MSELLVQDVRWEIDYKIHVGAAWSRFLNGLGEKRILGSTCESCGRTYVPPQAFCESCHEAVDTWIDVPTQGTLHAATIVYRGFKGGPEAPYAVGAIKLDGTDSLFMHFIGGVDLADPDAARRSLRSGVRLQVVWADERSGTILDIAHFLPIAA